MWFVTPKILKHKSIQIQNPTYVFLDTPDLIKLLPRISPNLQEANADYANAGRGAQGPAAAARVRMQAVWSLGVSCLCCMVSRRIMSHY